MMAEGMCQESRVCYFSSLYEINEAHKSGVLNFLVSKARIPGIVAVILHGCDGLIPRERQGAA